jgi:hypothetical protein
LFAQTNGTMNSDPQDSERQHVFLDVITLEHLTKVE